MPWWVWASAALYAGVWRRRREQELRELVASVQVAEKELGIGGDDL
jgi:hypothetical protein